MKICKERGSLESPQTGRCIGQAAVALSKPREPNCTNKQLREGNAPKGEELCDISILPFLQGFP